MGWFELMWFGSTWIKSESLWFQFRIKLVWFGSMWIKLESLWLKISEFMRPNFWTSKMFSRSVFRKIFCLQGFQFRFSLCHARPSPCRRYPINCFLIRICCSCSLYYTMGLCSRWVPVGSSQCSYQSSTRIWEHQYHYSNYRWGSGSDHCVPMLISSNDC